MMIVYAVLNTGSLPIFKDKVRLCRKYGAVTAHAIFVSESISNTSAIWIDGYVVYRFHSFFHIACLDVAIYFEEISQFHIMKFRRQSLSLP